MKTQLSPDLFSRFQRYGEIGCPMKIVENLATAEIVIAESAFLKHGPEAVEYKTRSPHVADYMVAYRAGLRK